MQATLEQCLPRHADQPHHASPFRSILCECATPAPGRIRHCENAVRFHAHGLISRRSETCRSCDPWRLPHWPATRMDRACHAQRPSARTPRRCRRSSRGKVPVRLEPRNCIGSEARACTSRRVSKPNWTSARQAKRPGSAHWSDRQRNFALCSVPGRSTQPRARSARGDADCTQAAAFGVVVRMTLKPAGRNVRKCATQNAPKPPGAHPA